MEEIFKNYNILVEEFNNNKGLVEDYFDYIMTVSLFMNEKNIAVNNQIYDTLLVDLIKKLNNGSLGPLSGYEDYYNSLKVSTINEEIIRYLNEIKKVINNSTPLGKAILNFRKLIYINRRGWIDRKVPQEYYESDALHTMQMFALISMLYASRLVDIKEPKKTYEMILIHEIGEIVSDDISELDPRHKNMKDLEIIGVTDTFESIGCGEYFTNLWKEFSEKKTKIARLAYEIDKLDAVLKANFISQEISDISIFKEFFEYEENRNTFDNSEVKPLFEIVRRLNYK